MKYKAYLIPLVSLLAIALFIWLFSKVVIYMLIALVLSLLAQPLVKFYSRIRYKRYDLPGAIVAALSLVTMVCSLIFLFYLFVPILINEIRFLSTLNFNDVFADIVNQFPQVKQLLLNFGSEKEISTSITTQINSVLNFNNISNLLNGFASIAGSLIGGTLAVLFITFFLLKEDKMVYRSLLLITPTNYEEEMKDILRTTKSLLTKYFVGLFIDVVVVGGLVTTLMLVCGVKNAVIIGVFTGLMNIIPYVGPLISFAFAAFLGVTGCIEFGLIAEIGPTLTKIFFILLGVNIVDGFFVQPYIFSNSVKAHPLEIFLVILMAATVAGIWGMVVAIPTYTLLRIVAKEFLVNFKFFKKITENIPE
ncbi:MAG: AI-2E family transporter [Bacteroidia bacterium]